MVDSERETFERQHGWTIKTMEREPSPVRDEYAPVIFSQETVSYIESLDMMSGEVHNLWALLVLFLKVLICCYCKFWLPFRVTILPWRDAGG